MIMQGFVGFRIPLWLRRAVTMIPAFVVVAYGVDATNALVLSQVVLSLTLPVPMIALLFFTGRRDVMGDFANTWWMNGVASVAAAAVLALNLVLLLQATGLAFAA
jgi:manganese transport protein